MRHLFALFMFFLFATSQANAQAGSLSQESREKLRIAEDTLSALVHTIMTDSTKENRLFACDQILPTLADALKAPNSFSYKFKKLDGISIQYPADSSFRIFTWQLFVHRNDYKYYGVIQMNTADLALYPLVDRSELVSPRELEYKVMNSDNWYGNIVYDIVDVYVKRKPQYYLLFGFDSFEAYRRRKIVDVLYFDEVSGKPNFGKAVFVQTPSYEGEMPRKQLRLFQEYSAASYATLKYDQELEMIMQENLITVSGNHGEGPVNVPDGSYVGYKFDKKTAVWNSVNKVYNHIYEKAPRTRRLEDDGIKRDLYGRRKH